VVLVFICNKIGFHVVDEVIDCGVLILLWVTEVVVYDHICRLLFSTYVECQCCVNL
jgi:hypothetical protein